jgi:DNA-binding SARP family transcriptional activator
MGDRPRQGGDGSDGSDGAVLRLAILGPVTGSRGGVPVALGPARLRAVLTLLVLHADAGLSRADIVDALWADDPPGTAATMVHGYIARIRALLGDGRACAATQHPKRGLSWDGARYRLAPAAVGSDLAEFTGLARLAGQAAANGDAAGACQRYEQSLRLWRAEPAADIELLRGHPAVIELSERRTSLIVDYAATAETAGAHEQVLGHLQALAGRAPLDERVHARLMIALAATGQQAAALGIYENIRRRLDEELGILPARELAEAHLRVLHQQAAPTPVPQPALARPPVPRQLPVSPRHFAGRARELQALTGLLEQAAWKSPGTVVISAIGGTAGVGKTALAVHWAHQIAHQFPGGQLYVNLRGFDPYGNPVEPADAIRRFLDALGVPADRIPATAEAQQDLYRSLLAGKRMLIVLDNARDAEQVRPLLPSSPACLVLVTSRRLLTNLVAAEGAHPVTLDVLSPSDAHELLARRLGPERMAAEPEMVTELTELCARLPLALAIAAARTVMFPGPLTTVVSELRDAAGRLDALDTGEAASSVRGVLSWSYQHLPMPTARMFRLLGLHPGPDISETAAASLAGIGLPQARAALGELVGANLLARDALGRFAFHDLLRVYAAERARAEDSGRHRRAARLRMLDHYLHTADAAALVLFPHRDTVQLGSAKPGVRLERMATFEQAMAWFDAEHRVLLAVVRQAAAEGFDIHAWQLPSALTTFLDRRGCWQDYATVHEIALAATLRLGDQHAQAHVLNFLGHASNRLGHYDEAFAHYEQALGLYRQLGDASGQGRVLLGIGLALERQGRHRESLARNEQALDLYTSVGNRDRQAMSLNNIGWCHLQLGDYPQALTWCEQAVALHRELGDSHSEAAAWDSCGFAHDRLGQPAEASACYQQALMLFQKFGDRRYQAEVLTHLGDSRYGDGKPELAVEAWQQALAILDELSVPDADELRAKLEAAGQPANVTHNR